jgi:hypothetical protein
MRVVGSAFAQVLTHVSASLFANLVATALSVPIVLAVGAVAFGTRSFSLVPLGVALLVGILPNPCTAGVQSVAHELATGGNITFRDHWLGFRRYARPAAIAWAGSLVITAVILGNLAFYAHAVGSSTGALHALAPTLFLLWLLLCIPWISVHMFVFPLLIEQEVKNIRLVYRNALLMAMARPSVMAVVLPLWISLLLVATTTGLATFIGLAISASIQQNATAKLLPTFRLHGAA